MTIPYRRSLFLVRRASENASHLVVRSTEKRVAVASERPVHPRVGEGFAGDKFRVSGTKEMVEGAGANKVSEVLSEASCCRCGTSNFTKERPTSFLYPLHGTAHAFRVKYQSRVVKNGTKCKKV